MNLNFRLHSAYMLVSTHRVSTLGTPCAAADAAVLAVALACKNLRNAETFVLRNVMTAYEWSTDSRELVLKASVHEHQVDCLFALNQALEEVNAEQVERQVRKQLKSPDTESSTPSHAGFQLLDEAIRSSTLNQALSNQTVLTRAVRLHQSGADTPDFTALPAVFAHPVSARMAGLFKQTVQARIQFFKDKKAGTLGKRGVPSLPAYLGKNERCSFELDANYLAPSGALPQLSFERHSLRQSFGGAELDAAAAGAWNGLRLRPLLEREALKLKERLQKKGAQIQEVVFRQLRFVVKGLAVKWQAVFELRVEEAQSSALGQARAAYEASRTDKDKPFERLSPSRRDEVLLAYVKAHESSFKVVAGLDPGVTNHATLAFSAGGGHQIFSGQRMNAWLTRRAERLDNIKSRLHAKLLPAPLYRKLLSNRSEPDKALRVPFTKDEKVLLARASSELHAHPEYVACLAQTQRGKSNYLHQLSNALIERCTKQDAQVLVIGRNKGWKDEVDRGRQFNRLFTTIAHYELVEQLKSKGELLGLIVIDTEESYTSKMSFVHADPLPVHGKSPADGSKKGAPQVNGVREGTYYKLKTRPDGVMRSTVHADLNGALNIIRKAVTSFCFKPGFSLSFALMGFDGRWQPFYRGRAPSAG